MKTKANTLQKPRRFNVLAAVISGVALVSIGLVVVTSHAASGTATMSLTPATAIQNNGTTFTVQIYEDSGTATVNAVQANLSYPTAGLTLTNIDATNSGFPLSAQQTGANGVIQIARAINGGTQPVTGKQLIATLTFQSLMTTGSATVSFTTGSAVVSSVDNTALVLTTQNGTYSPDTTPPTVPTNVHVTANTTGTSVSIGWNSSTDNVAVTGYNVYRDGVNIATLNADAVGYTDLNLQESSTHTYQVTAFDAAGNESAKSSAVTVTTPDTIPPSVPTNISATASAYNKVVLNWGSSVDTGGSGLAGYRIYRNGASTPLFSVAPTPAQPTFTDTTVQGSTTYTYSISAYDGAGNESAKSGTVTVTTPAPPDTTPPTTPTNLTMTANFLNYISLSWTASTDDVAVTGYQVFRNNVQIATLNANTTSYTDSGLMYGTTYTYDIKAFDAAGNLSQPAAISASTLPLKVGDINMDNKVDVLDLSILLSDWDTNAPAADLNHDGIVNIYDLSILISNWGS